MGILGKIIGNAGIDRVIDKVGETVDRFVTTDKEREELKRAIELDLLKDRQSARTMYMTDSWLQKVFALVFLAGYIGLTVIVVRMLMQMASGEGIQMPDWGIALINMMWGGLSAKLNTITDFLFGSSSGSARKDEIIKSNP